MGVHPRLSLSSRLGHLIALDVAVGLYKCDDSDVFESATNAPDTCNARRGWSRATVLPAGAVHTVTLRGTRDEDYEGTLAGDAFDLTGTLTARGTADAFVLTVSFPGVVPE